MHDTRLSLAGVRANFDAAIIAAVASADDWIRLVEVALSATESAAARLRELARQDADPVIARRLTAAAANLGLSACRCRAATKVEARSAVDLLRNALADLREVPVN